MAERITHRMKLFCHYLSNGEPQTSAYSKAYENPNLRTCQAAASKMMNNPLVKDYLSSLEKVRFDSTKTETDAAKKELWKIALDDSEATGNRIRALDIINKMNCVYSDANTTGDQTTNINFGDMSADELRKLISSQSDNEDSKS